MNDTPGEEALCPEQSPEPEEDVLDWDAHIPDPPPRQSGTILVRLIYDGPSKPIPEEDPWADGNQ
jgi:hypothetical protein